MSIPSFVISLRYLSFYCFLHPKIVAFGQCVEVDGRNSQSELIEKLHDVFFVSFLGSVVTQRIFFWKSWSKDEVASFLLDISKALIWHTQNDIDLKTPTAHQQRKNTASENWGSISVALERALFFRTGQGALSKSKVHQDLESAAHLSRTVPLRLERGWGGGKGGGCSCGSWKLEARESMFFRSDLET